MNKKTWLVLDCNYLCHRAKHSMGGLSHENVPTGVIYGFLRSIPAYQDLFQTPYIIFCWDSKTSKRKEFHPGYKSDRHSRELTDEEEQFEQDFRIQMKKLRKIYLRKIGFRNIFCQKGYEADDIIVSVCKNLKLGNDAIIISSDQDLYQCIRYNIICYNPQTHKLMTPQGFRKKYGLTTSEWPMVKALAGCKSDGIAGLRGVGEKTAIKYLRGELKSPAKLRIITSRMSIELYHVNYALVKLPYIGTKKFKLKEDELSKEGWREVSDMLGMKSIRTKMPMRIRKKNVN